MFQYDPELYNKAIIVAFTDDNFTIALLFSIGNMLRDIHRNRTLSLFLQNLLSVHYLRLLW